MKNRNLLKYLLIACIIILPSCSVDENKENIENKIRFPEDHGFHNNIIEWVYFSGIINTDQEKQLAFMFTIFQYQESFNKYLYPSLLAIIDIENLEYRKFQQNNPGIYSEDAYGYPSITAGSSMFAWTENDNIFIMGESSPDDSTRISIDLNLVPTKKPLLHGENGFIQMSDGSPSAYYSFTNLLPVNGEIEIEEEKFLVTGGRVWMDRQWGDMTTESIRWDWFSLRMNDGGSLMIYQFRDFSGEPAFGNWTYRNSEDSIFYGNDLEITASRYYENYPIDWRIKLPSLNAEFDIIPKFDDQAFQIFWEGVSSFNGTINNKDVEGTAFVELSGYTDLPISY
jgi:predicted secreted hydrolase